MDAPVRFRLPRRMAVDTGGEFDVVTRAAFKAVSMMPEAPAGGLSSGLCKSLITGPSGSDPAQP